MDDRRNEVKIGEQAQECSNEKLAVKGLIQKEKKKCWDDFTTRIKEDGRSGWFKTKIGVQQGSCLSPLLFIIIIDKVLKEVKRKNPTTNALVFADDVMVRGETEAEAQARPDLWQEAFTTLGLKISKTKTVVSPTVHLRIGDKEMDIVDNFQYLDSVLSGQDFAQVFEVRDSVDLSVFCIETRDV